MVNRPGTTTQNSEKLLITTGKKKKILRQFSNQLRKAMYGELTLIWKLNFSITKKTL